MVGKISRGKVERVNRLLKGIVSPTPTHHLIKGQLNSTLHLFIAPDFKYQFRNWKCLFLFFSNAKCFVLLLWSFLFLLKRFLKARLTRKWRKIGIYWVEGTCKAKQTKSFHSCSILTNGACVFTGL